MGVDLSFSVVDYVVFGAMLFVSLMIGVYHAFRGGRTNEDYLMGGHSIGVIPMAIRNVSAIRSTHKLGTLFYGDSLCASFNSAYMILGIPSEIYTYGTQFYIMIFGTGIGVYIAGEIWIPVLYKLNIISMYEYFELRYNSRLLRLIMTIIFILKTIMYLGIVLYAPTVALAAVTSISWQAAIVVLGVSSTIYTTIGGMKAVVWTDVFQIVIVLGGIVGILVLGLIRIDDGWAGMWQEAEHGDRIEFFNMSLDVFERHTFFNVLFGTMIIWGSPYVCSQYLVQRCCCMPTLTKAKLALYINYIGQFVMTTCVAIIGLIMYSYYLNCDPVLANIVETRDALIPLFVLQEFSALPGIAGLFISCLFSGALSTLDSALNSLAAVTWEEAKVRTLVILFITTESCSNLLQALPCFDGVSKRMENNITKALSVIFGVVAIGLAFVCHGMGSLISVGSRLFGAAMGPMFGLCLISVLGPFVNIHGALSGLVVGQVLNMWLSLGAMIYAPAAQTRPLNATDCSVFNMTVDDTGLSMAEEKQPVVLEADEEPLSIYLLSYNLYPIIGFVTTMIVSVVVSLITCGNKDLVEEDSKYFHPMAWKFYKLFKPSLPKQACHRDKHSVVNDGLAKTTHAPVVDHNEPVKI